MGVIIDKASLADSKKIAQIHIDEIKTGFLSSLGVNFLTALYKAMIESETVLVAKNNNEVIGFVSGTNNLKTFYKKMLLKNFLTFLRIAAPKILKSSRKIFETLIYPNKIESNLPKAEILSIAVKEPFQKRGVGKNLFAECKKRLGVKEIKMIVGENLNSSHELMRSLGGKNVQIIEVHQGIKSYIYVS